jgi:hypothetical protein
MTKLNPRAPSSNGGVTPLPLLEYGERVRVRALPCAARRLVRRYGLTAAAAYTVALAAGFNVEPR